MLKCGVQASGVATSINGLIDDGTNVTITGAGTTASPYVISAAGGSPGGSTTQIQYNDAGVFAGDSNNIWDNVNKRQGVQVASPQSSVHAAAAVGTVINNVVTGSVSLVNEILPSAFTGAITQIAMPAAGTGGSVSYVDGGSGSAITANGTTYYFRISPCLLANGIYYRSENNEVVSAGDPNDAQSYNIQISFGSVTISGETVEYYIEYSTDGVSYSPLVVTTSSPYVATSLSGSDSTTAWPSYYQNSPGVAPNAFTAGSATATSIGSGGINEVNATIDVQVDSVANINGTDYVSGTPTSGSFSDSGLGTYNAEISWTDNGAAINAIARISQDAGVTWYYQFTGSSTSPYTFTNLSNDPAAEARWGQTYSAGSITHNFAPYGTGAAPSGNTIYSTAGTTYSTSIAADSVKYILKHSFTGLSGSGKVLAPQAAPTNGLIVTGALYDVGYVTWGSGTTVTPNSYGFTGTNQNRDYRAYGFNSTLGIYSITPLTLSTTSSGGTKSVSGSVTYPSGVSQIKLVRQINGGGYVISKTLNSPTTAFTDDSTDGSWTGNTTVTPTTVLGTAARYDRDSIAVTDLPIVEVIATGATTPKYPKISFGVATNSSSTPSYLAHLYANSTTGYFHAVTGRLNIESSLGATPSTYLGSAGNMFNNGNSSTIHFQIKGSSNNNLFQTRSDHDSVYIGGNPSDLQATLVVQPHTSADVNVVLKGHSSHSSTSQVLRTEDSAGTFGGAITVAGHMQAGAGSAATCGLSFRADSDTGFYNPTGNTLAAVTGGTERWRLISTGLFLGGSTSATARLHIAAGTTSANTAPIKFTSGSLNTTPEVGAFEFLTDRLYYTRTSSSTRMFIAASTAAPVAGRVAYSDANGFYQDTANFTYSGNRLSPTYITLAASTTSAGTAPIKYTSGTLMTTAEAGAQEFLTDKYYATITTGAARKEYTLNDVALVSGNLPVVTTNGRLTNSAGTGYVKATAGAVSYQAAPIPRADGGTGQTSSPIKFTNVVDANNSGTAETDLYSNTLAAGQLATNSDIVIAQYGGVFVGDATSTQQLKAYFGGSLIFDSGALGFGVGTTNWDLYVTIIRVSASVVRCSATLNTSFASLSAYAKYTEVTGLTLANTQVLKITGQAAGVSGASSQITAKEGYIEYKPS